MAEMCKLSSVQVRNLTSATNSGRTQCTRLSTSGDPKRLVRGGGTSSEIVPMESGCSLRHNRSSSACLIPVVGRPWRWRRLNGLYKRDGPGVTNRAVCSFFAWLEQHGIGGLVDIEPFHVAAYIKALKVSDAGNPAVKERAAARPTVKQHLAAIRMLRGSGPKGLPR